MRLDSYIKSGVMDSIPIVISFLFVFSSLGALYQEKGLQLIETTLGTVLIFAAPLQISAVDLLSKEQVLAALALTTLVNFRFLFMSMVASQYFKGVAKIKVFLSLLMFSASTYAVSHSHFKSSGLNEGRNQFNYYLGVSIPSYVVAILATVVGYFLASYLNYASIELFVAMILPIHFTALTAKNAGKGLTVLATVVGGLCAPLLVGWDTVWLVVGLPVAAGAFFAWVDSVRQKSGSA